MLIGWITENVKVREFFFFFSFDGEASERARRVEFPRTMQPV